MHKSLLDKMTYLMYVFHYTNKKTVPWNKQNDMLGGKKHTHKHINIQANETYFLAT